MGPLPFTQISSFPSGISFIYLPLLQFSVVQFNSFVHSCPVLWNPMNCSTPGLPVHHQLPESTQTHVHWLSDVIQPSHPLSSPSPPALNISQHQGFSNESALHIRWPKYWSFSFNISPTNEHSGLICFRMDWLDLLAVQGTLKSLLQHHSSKASILLCSAFFIVQLSQCGSQNSNLGRNHSRGVLKKRKTITFMIRRPSFRFWLCHLLCKLE